MKRLFPLLVPCLFVACLLPSCLSDDEYSTAASDHLTFSVDTLSLDTLISGRATNTYTFEVYNRSDKALRITSVQLENGVSSAFKVNVDGVSLENGAANNLEIAGGDSLRVFLFANLPDRDNDEPLEVSDRLVFTTEGGAVDAVVLRAWGQDVIPITVGTFDADTTLSASRPYVVSDTLIVGENATLTLAAGTRLYFSSTASLLVRGRLVAEGTAAKPIMFRGDRLGYMFSNQPYDRIPAQWGGIVFECTSYGNCLDHCDIHSGTGGIRCDSSDVSRETLRMENTVLHNMSGNCLTVRAANVFVGNSQITNAGGNCVELWGGNSTFIHCTIANFYAFSGGRGVALTYANHDGDIRLPLYAATFQNCLITGYSDDEIISDQSARYTDDAFNFAFHSCLLDTPEASDENITNCLWDNSDNAVCREGNFAPDFDLNQLIFTFVPAAESKAVNAADATVSRTYYQYDLNGRDRLADESPDIGCYELITKN